MNDSNYDGDGGVGGDDGVDGDGNGAVGVDDNGVDGDVNGAVGGDDGAEASCEATGSFQLLQGDKSSPPPP